ncbi:unnamed protein product [Arctogadus glacialis]
MDFFDKLKWNGYFAVTFLDKSLVQFCFLYTIQEELEEVSFAWNEHRMRRVHNSRSPHGCPSIIMQCLNSTGPRTTCIAQVWRRSRPAWGSLFTKTSHVMMCFTFVWGLTSEHGLELTNDVYKTVD